LFPTLTTFSGVKQSWPRRTQHRRHSEPHRHPANANPSEVFAFDTGRANMLIDALVSRFTHIIRALIKTHTSLFAANSSLSCSSTHAGSVPRTEATEKYRPRIFRGAYVEKVRSLGRRYRAKPNDLIRTATIFTSLSIVDALHRFVLPKANIHQLIVSGGGFYNPLLHRPTRRPPRFFSRWGTPYRALFTPNKPLPGIDVLSSGAFGIPVDAKEALPSPYSPTKLFIQRPSNLPSATGARGPAILGKISYAPPR